MRLKEGLHGTSTLLAINSRGIPEANAAREAGASIIHMPEATIQTLSSHCKEVVLGASVHSVVGGWLGQLSQALGQDASSQLMSWFVCLSQESALEAAKCGCHYLQVCSPSRI